MENLGYSSFLTNRYGINLSDLALHYIIICGEIPNDYIKKIFGKNNWKYIAYKSKYKGLFISKQKDNLKGFQLSKKAIKYIDKLPYDYSLYLRPDGQLREVTTDFLKRDRYSKALILYYTLDQWGIEYLSERINYDDYHFIDSRIIKNYFNSIKDEFARSPDKNFQIAGSQSFGILKFRDNSFYSIYMSCSSIIMLSHNTEWRYCDFVQRNIFEDCAVNPYGQAIFFEYVFSDQRVFCGTSLLLLTEEKEFNVYLEINYIKLERFASFIRENYNSSLMNRFLGVPLIHIHSQNKMKYFFNKKVYDEEIRQLILRKQGESATEIEDRILRLYPANTVYNNLPCVFLLDLNIYWFYHFMQNSILYKTPYCFVCFGEDKRIIEETLYHIYRCNNLELEINVVTIEELAGDDFFND